MPRKLRVIQGYLVLASRFFADCFGAVGVKRHVVVVAALLNHSVSPPLPSRAVEWMGRFVNTASNAAAT